jgi:hypothetical protein
MPDATHFITDLDRTDARAVRCALERHAGSAPRRPAAR